MNIILLFVRMQRITTFLHNTSLRRSRPQRAARRYALAVVDGCWISVLSLVLSFESLDLKDCHWAAQPLYSFICTALIILYSKKTKMEKKMNLPLGGIEQLIHRHIGTGNLRRAPVRR